MNRTKPAFPCLLLGAFVLAGCADRAVDESVADAPAPAAPTLAEPETAAEAEPSGTDAPDAHDAAASETTEPAEAVVGAAAPDFVATGLDGELNSLSEYLGEQNVVLAFSRAHW